MMRRMKRLLDFVIGVQVVSIVLSLSAFAARLGTIQVDQLQALTQPAAGSPAVGLIPKGELVTVGNSSLNGFVKVRSRSGVIGFVPESSIRITAAALPAAPQAPALPKAPAMPRAPAIPSASGLIDQQKSQVDSSRQALQNRMNQKKAKFRKLQANFFGGLAFISPTDVYSLLQISSSKPGISFGIETSFRFDKMFAGILRVEKFSKSLLANDSAGKAKYSVTLESMPIMVGGALKLLDDPFTIDFAALVGMANGTKASVVSSQKSSPNTTAWAASVLTYMVKTDLNLALGKSFLIFGEVGYRILSSASLTAPSTAGNGSEDFKDGASYKAVKVNFSGLFLGGGFGFRF